MFNHFIGNKLFTSLQFGFLEGDLCIAQLLAIIHDNIFDSNPPVDVRGVFFKTHLSESSLLFKLKSYGVKVELLSLLECYLSNREQRVVLNGQTSDWKKKILVYHRGQY